MRNKLFYLSILMFSVISCKKDMESKSEHLEKLKAENINTLANRYLELNRFSGVILMARNNNIIYNESFGFADYEKKKSFSEKSTFKIGRISELITENIIQEMAKNGDFQLSDSISKYIPEIKADFTINDLLNHNTHFPSILQIQRQNPELKYSTIVYANLGSNASETSESSDLDYNILGLLIEKISGTNLQKNIQNYATNFGLENTYFQKQDTSLAVGYLYNNYRGNGDELHKSPSADLDITFSSNGLKSTAKDLLKIINQNKELDIHGYLENDGFSYSLVNDPKTQTAIIVLSNRRHPVAEEILTAISQILQEKEYRLPLSRKPFAIDKNSLNDYSGTYALNQNMNFDVVNENDSLFVLFGQSKMHIIPQSNNEFYMEQTDASMRFLRDSTNIVSEVVLLNGFLDGDKAYRLEK